MALGGRRRQDRQGMARHRQRPHRGGHRTGRRESHPHRWLRTRLGWDWQRTGHTRAPPGASEAARHHTTGHTRLHVPVFRRPSFPHRFRPWSCGFRQQRLSPDVYKPPTTHAHTPASNTPHVT